MSRALEIRAFPAVGLSPEAGAAASAPPVVVAKRAGLPDGEGLAPIAAKLGAIAVLEFEIPRIRARRRFGLGAAASFALHTAIFLGALLWSQSRVERAPEPIAVEIVVERAPDPAPAARTPIPSPVPETPQPPAPEPIPSPVATAAPPPPVAEAPPPPPPTPEPIPSPVAETPTPAPVPSPVATVEPPAAVAETPPPPAPTPAPIPSPVADAPPPPKPVVEPKPVAKIEPPKPTPAAKKADRAPTPAKPKSTPKPPASRDASAVAASASRAAASASSASVGEYRDAVYARIRARQHFPESARESGAHGTAELNFALDEAGQLKSVAIVKSSGEAALDADALATVRRSAPFGPPPPGAPRDYAVKLHYALQ